MVPKIAAHLMIGEILDGMEFSLQGAKKSAYNIESTMSVLDR